MRRLVSYGYNNRTQMLRIPGRRAHRGPHGRRILQPVLAATVVLAAGLDGSSGAWTGGAQRAGPRRDRQGARRSSASTVLPRQPARRHAELERGDVLAPPMGCAPDQNYCDYTWHASGARQQAHERYAMGNWIATSSSLTALSDEQLESFLRDGLRSTEPGASRPTRSRFTLHVHG